jgi:hypothetical protein
VIDAGRGVIPSAPLIYFRSFPVQAPRVENAEDFFCEVIMSYDKKKVGWIEKYRIERTDGADDVGGKHEHCELYVLDITHDPLAQTAALEYAASAFHAGYKLLAKDIVRKVKESPRWHPDSVSRRLEWEIHCIEE